MKSLPEWLLLFPMAAVIVAVSLMPAVLAFLWEKRLVWPYVSLDHADGPRRTSPENEGNPYAVGHAVEEMGVLAPSPYAVRAIEAARSEGFVPLGIFADGKGRLYRVRYDFWLSGDGVVLALVGCGTIAGIPVKNTWLYTRLADGHLLVTIDDQKASEYDLAGLSIEALVRTSSFGKLLGRHRERVIAAGVPTLRYSEANPLGDHGAHLSRRIDRLQELGYASYLDPEQTAWRYTPRGALAVALRSYCRGMRRVFWPDSWKVSWRSPDAPPRGSEK